MGSEMKSSETWKPGAGLPKDSFREAKSAAGSSATGSVGAISDHDFETLRRDFAKLKDTVGDLAQKQATAAKEQLADSVGAVSQSVGTTAAATKDTLISFEQDLEARVREQPLGAIMLSLLVGIVIGKMF